MPQVNLLLQMRDCYDYFIYRMASVVGVGDNKSFKLLKIFSEYALCASYSIILFSLDCFFLACWAGLLAVAAIQRMNLSAFVLLKLCNVIPTIAFKWHFNKFPETRSNMKWNNMGSTLEWLLW